MTLRMPFYGCRTCLSNEKGNKLVNITTKCWLEKTIKDLIIRIVPEMSSTICDEDLVCKKCINIIKTAMEFIETCLEVEIIRAEKQAILQTNDVDDFWEYQEDELFENEKNEKNEDEILQYTVTHETVNLDHDYCVNNSPKLLSELLLPVLSDESSNDADDCEKNKHISEDISERVSFKENVEGRVEYNNVSVKQGCENIENINSSIQNIEMFADFKDEKDNISIGATEGRHENGYNAEKETQLCRQKKLHDSRKEKSPFICEICGHLCQNFQNLEMHKESRHSDQTYVCDKCPKKFKTRRHVVAHVKRAHGKSNRRQCDECGKFFSDEKTLKNHQRLVHLKDKPYVCQICDKVFGRKDYLQNHIVVHTGIMTPAQARCRRKPKYGISLKDPGKPVPCKICGKMIVSVHMLKVHLEKHIKLRRFKCKFCGLAFASRSNCERHSKLHAADPENKFRCGICWKRLKTEGELAHHVGLHENRPPRYSCDICGEKFHRKYLLDNHHTIQHLTAEDIAKAEEEIICKNLLEYSKGFTSE